MKSRFTDAMKKKIAEERKSGISMKILCAKYHVCAKTLRTWINQTSENGDRNLTCSVCRRQKKSRFSEDFCKAIVARYEAGEAISALCEEVKIGRSTLYRWIKLYTEYRRNNGEKFTIQDINRLIENALFPKRGDDLWGGETLFSREKRSIFCSRWSQKAYQIISPQWEYSVSKIFNTKLLAKNNSTSRQRLYNLKDATITALEMKYLPTGIGEIIGGVKVASIAVTDYGIWAARARNVVLKSKKLNDDERDDIIAKIAEAFAKKDIRTILMIHEKYK